MACLQSFDPDLGVRSSDEVGRRQESTILLETLDKPKAYVVCHRKAGSNCPSAASADNNVIQHGGCKVVCLISSLSHSDII